MKVDLLIADATGKKAYRPVVEEGITWSTERRGTPGKLTFKMLWDKKLKVSEGCAVCLKVDGKKIFYGFIFKQQRTKEQLISVTAYDQLRYLKNKDTKVYEGKTAAPVSYTHLDVYKRQAMSRMNDKQVVKVKNSDVTNIHIRKLNNAGENFLTESGVYKLVFKSRKPNAEKFTDWIADEVLPSIKTTEEYPL